MHPRAEVQEFLDLAGQEHDGIALGGKITQIAIQVELGADIDAARRIVQHQHSRFFGKRAGNQHFLLVAARQRGDEIVAAAHAHRQLACFPVEDRRQLGRVDQVEETARPVFAVDRDQQVLENRQIGENALFLAVAADIADLVAARRGQILDRVRGLVADKRDPACCQRLHASDATRKIGLALAVEAGDPDDLAGIQGKMDGRGFMPDAGVLNAQHRVVACALRWTGALQAFIGRGPGDQFQNAAFRDLVLVQAADIDPVAQHRRPVGDAHQFGYAVGDDQNAGTVLRQPPHFTKQPFGRFKIERGG